jgi:hypothetical protein
MNIKALTLRLFADLAAAQRPHFDGPSWWNHIKVLAAPFH